MDHADNIDLDEIGILIAADLGVWCQTMFYVSDPVRNIPVVLGQT